MSKNMAKNRKWLNAAVIAASLLACMKWEFDSNCFVGQAEWEVLKKLFTSPAEVISPFVLIPFTGHLLLLATLFQKMPSSKITFLGIGLIGLLMAFLLLLAILACNVLMLISLLPFAVVATTTVIYNLRSSL